MCNKFEWSLFSFVRFFFIILNKITIVKIVVRGTDIVEGKVGRSLTRNHMGTIGAEVAGSSMPSLPYALY